MKNKSFLLTALAVVCLLTACPRPAAAYIKAPPQTLGSICLESDHIAVLRVDKVSVENGVILFKHVEQLKGKHDGTVMKHVIRPDVKGAKVILDWAAEGKPAVMFYFTCGNDRGHVYLDGYWYWVGGESTRNPEDKKARGDFWWSANQGEPTLLSIYSGTADQLHDAVTKILRGEEVLVPSMASDDKQALEQRRGKVQDVRASLKIVGADSLARIASRSDGKKPVDKKQETGDKKPDENKPAFVGTVKALSADGKSFTLLLPPMAKNKEPTAIDIQIGEGAAITAGKEPGKLAVGQIVSVWLGKSDVKIATTIRIGKPPEKPEKKPAPEERKPDLVGTVKALSPDGKSFSLLPAPTEKNKEPAAIDIQIGEATKITADKDPGKLAVGQTVSVWLQMQKGSSNVAVRIHIGKLPEPDKKPAPPDKKPAPDATDKKPDEPKKPKEPAKPARDPAPTAAVIDAEVDRRLATDKIPASPQADDAEFLRRVTLDLTGRIPTYQQTVAFLDSKDPDKRRKLIDELLDSSAYGEHFAGVWRGLLIPRELNLNGKGGGQRDTFSPWLAEQFNDNRGWNALVTEMLTAEGTPADNPATAFLIANGVSGQSQPGKVAGAVTGLFLGINLRCAECHQHPLVNWKQKDFWGTAAFFGKTQYGGVKGGGRQALTESLSNSGGGSTKQKGQSGPMLRGTAIVIPSTSGKAAGQLVKARFLGGAEPELDEKEPFRPRFAAWATAADNPYFARAAVNRMWAHFFGRGFVNPLDEFDESNPPSHPELLDRLANEFTASGFDLKHLARCIANSKAYQRSSRPVPGNEADVADFSHMAVKVLTPEVLCDTLSIIVKGSVEKQEIRDQFVRSFRVDEESAPTEYIQGIPQMLRLMNAPTRGGSSKEKGSSDRGAPLVEKLYNSKASRTEAIATLYLTVLSRRPTTNEVELMSGYLSRRKDDQEGYRGVLWILLNSSEFALNR